MPRSAAHFARPSIARSTSAAVGSHLAAPFSHSTNASWASRYAFKANLLMRDRVAFDETRQTILLSRRARKRSDMPSTIAEVNKLFDAGAERGDHEFLG